MAELGEKPEKARIHLRILLVCAITGLVALGVIGATALQVQSFRQHSKAEAIRAVDKGARAVLAEVNALLAPAHALVDYFQARPVSDIAGPAPEGRAHHFAHFTRSAEIVADQAGHLSTAYVGHSDGSIVVLARNTPKLRSIMKLPDQAASSLLMAERDRTDDRTPSIWSWRENGRWNSVERPHLDYDPRKRPWYHLAEGTSGPAWTSPYRSNVEGDMRVTLASALRDRNERVLGVLGIDITLDNLIKFVRELEVSPNGFAFIARENGTLFAHEGLQPENLGDAPGSNTATLFDVAGENPVEIRVFEAFAGSRDAQVQIEVEGRTIVARRLPVEMPGFDANLYVGAPLADFTAAADEALLWAITVTAIMALFVVGFGVLIARAVTKPITRAVNAMQAVARLELSDAERPRRSPLVEIHALNGSVEVMRRAIHSFSKYVPVELVRDLVALRQPLEPGGQRREITVMFTDIAGFTRMTETEQHEQVIEDLADYFEILCSVIQSHGGTVDKFIGDGLMAFWGAPRDDDDHTRNACAALIEAQHKLNELNEKRLAAGKPPLHTRFGLHRGYAFVGNIGSRERLAYTAMGDVVNTAARLEGANKQLGTQALATRAVLANAGVGFNFKSQGKIELPGKQETIEAFEIVDAEEHRPAKKIELISSRCA